MRKLIASILILVCILGLTACADKTFERTETIEGNFKTYYKLSDGTWECDGHAYKYRLEFNGTMPNASVSSSFVYLSNIEDISFEQAYKAAGVSSNLNDYFDVEDAVLVEMATVEEIAPAQIAQIGNPWTTWSSIEEAENVVNFEFGLPEVVAERYVAEEIQTMNNEFIEVVYRDGEYEVCVRKQKGEGQDISGDYNEYEIYNEQETDGVVIKTYRNFDNNAIKQIVSYNGYSWVLVVPNGYWGESTWDFLNFVFNEAK